MLTAPGTARWCLVRPPRGETAVKPHLRVAVSRAWRLRRLLDQVEALAQCGERDDDDADARTSAEAAEGLARRRRSGGWGLVGHRLRSIVRAEAVDNCGGCGDVSRGRDQRSAHDLGLVGAGRARKREAVSGPHAPT